MYICLIDARMFFTKYVKPSLVGDFSCFFGLVGLFFFFLSYLEKCNGVFKKSTLNPLIRKNENKGMSLWSEG